MPKPLPDLPPHAKLTIRHLPHLDVPGTPTFVTFRLYDTLPIAIRKALYEQAEQWRKATSASDVVAHKRLIALMDKYLDEAAVQGNGPCYLKDAECATLFLKHLNFGIENFRYLIHAHCVMSNHVHVLMETLPKLPLENLELSWNAACKRRQTVELNFEGSPDKIASRYWSLSKVLQGLKSYSARDINRHLNRSGAFWQDESFDHVVRDEAEYHRVIAYIEENPVKAGLCSQAGKWPFSSAHW